MFNESSLSFELIEHRQLQARSTFTEHQSTSPALSVGPEGVEQVLQPASATESTEKTQCGFLHHMPFLILGRDVSCHWAARISNN